MENTVDSGGDERSKVQTGWYTELNMKNNK